MHLFAFVPTLSLTLKPVQYDNTYGHMHIFTCHLRMQIWWKSPVHCWNA